MSALRYLATILLAVMLAAGAQAVTLPAGQPLTIELAREALLPELRGRGSGDDVELDISTPTLPMGNPAGIPAEISVEALQHDAGSGTFAASLILDYGGGERTRLPVRGSARELVEIAVPARALSRGTIIGEADLDRLRIAVDRLQDDNLIDARDLIGSEVRRRLRAGRPIRRRDLGPVRMVRRGQPVHMLYQRPGLRLQTTGKALDHGALGQMVRVQNLDSRRQLTAVVSGPDLVTLGPVSGIDR